VGVSETPQYPYNQYPANQYPANQYPADSEPTQFMPPASGPPSSGPPSSGPPSSGPPSSGPPALPTSGSGYQPGYQAPYTPPPGYPPQSGYAQPGYAQPAYAPPPQQFDQFGRPLSDKSKLVAGILGIALGGFGAGRFYTGHTGIAVGQLIVTIFTCGLGHFWGLVDGILILVNGGTDAQGRVLRDS
jgi:TM2 domain-containing membrane protein YozV